MCPPAAFEFGQTRGKQYYKLLIYFSLLRALKLGRPLPRSLM
jgi:hypothetical protein